MADSTTATAPGPPPEITSPGGSTTGDLSANRPGRRPPPAVWLATLLFGLVTALWTVAVPAFRAPDEPAHVDLVLHLAEGHGYPTYDGRFFGREIGLGENRHLIDMDEPWPVFDAADAPARRDRPDVVDRGGTAPDPNARATDDRRAGYPYVYNQMPQHPPLYYTALAGVVRAERFLLPGDALTSFDRELGLLRLVNVGLVTPLPLLAWGTVTRLGGGQRAGTVASLLPLGVPQLTYIGAVVNNDNLLTLLGGVLAMLLAGVARGRRGRRTDLAVGAVLGLALLTKAFALMFVPWVIAAYGLGAWTTRRVRRTGVGLAVVGSVAAALGAWWWIGNWVREGEPAPTTETLTRTAAQRPEGFVPDAAGFAVKVAARLVDRTWAWVGYGTPKLELPGVAVALLTGAVAAAAALTVVRAVRGRGGDDGPRRPDVALAWLPVLLIALFVWRRSWGLYETTGKLAFVQGRYLFGAILPPMAVVGVGAVHGLGRRATDVVLAVVVSLQGWMLAEVVVGAWSGPGPFGPLAGALAWGAWPAAVVIGIGVAAVVTVVALAVTAGRSAG